MDIKVLEKKCSWVRQEMLKLHKLAPESRIASCLSDVEIFVALYYAGILKFDPKNPNWEGRDRFIVSKGHGGVSLYPILADLGFFPVQELDNICREGGILGSIPDAIPGFETINGSLGFGPGVGAGMAMALKKKNNPAKVFVLTGDGELCEGAVWEAFMFAAHQKLNNLIVIVDKNNISMLDFLKNQLAQDPLSEKFKAFNWETISANGHNLNELIAAINKLKNSTSLQPKVLIAETLKGKGIKLLENLPLCHIRTLKPEEIETTMQEME